MGSNDPRFELILLDGTIYEGWMGLQFTFVYQGVLAITQFCTGISEWYLWTGLID